MSEFMPFGTAQEPELADKVLSIRTQINSKSLTLQDVQDLSEDLLTVVEKTRLVASRTKWDQKSKEFFENESFDLVHDLEALETNMLEKDLALLEEIDQISREIHRLDLKFSFLPPNDICERLRNLSDRLEKIQKERFYSDFVQREIKHAKKRLNQVEFRYLFPLVEELNLFSYHKNFAVRIEGIARAIEKGNMSPFESLGESQKNEIFRHLARSRGSENVDFGKSLFYAQEVTYISKAKAVRGYLASLHDMCSIADQIWHGDEKERIHCFYRLNEEERDRTEEYLWRHAGKTFDDLRPEISSEGAKEALCVSIMDCLNEKMAS